jgi:hypothetical protein
MSILDLYCSTDALWHWLEPLHERELPASISIHERKHEWVVAKPQVRPQVTGGKHCLQMLGGEGSDQLLGDRPHSRAVRRCHSGRGSGASPLEAGARLQQPSATTPRAR